jgi:hypothetical protein
MARTEPLITPEELQCLLGSAPARRATWSASFWQHIVHVGAALWLVKGVFLYALLLNPETASLLGSTRYLGLRGSLEVLCLAAFWGAAWHPRGRTLASASMWVAGTTCLMDAMALLAFAG